MSPKGISLRDMYFLPPLKQCVFTAVLLTLLWNTSTIAAQQDTYYNTQQQQQQQQQLQQKQQSQTFNQNNPQNSFPGSQGYDNANQRFNTDAYNPNLNQNTNTRYRTDNFNDLPNDERPSTNYGNDEDLNFGRGKTSYNVKATFLESFHSREPTYFIVSSRMVRPGLIYKVAVSILRAQYPVTVHASISCDGVQISGDSKDVKVGVPETMLMRVPPTSVTGEYKLRVEGFYQDIFGGLAFLNETRLDFSQRSMSIFIQTDKPLYMQGETIRFRTIPITTELKGFDNAVDVYMLDPNRHIVRRWISR